MERFQNWTKHTYRSSSRDGHKPMSFPHGVSTGCHEKVQNLVWRKNTCLFEGSMKWECRAGHCLETNKVAITIITSFLSMLRFKPRWTNFCLVGSLGTSQWEASDIWHFFSCDVRKGHHSKARSIESIVRSKIIGMKICPHIFHIFQPFSLFNNKALPRIFAYFCTMSFSYVTLHIWTHLAEWGTNANDRWKYRQDCLHF